VNITTLLEMAADGFGDRVAIGSKADGLTYAQLQERALATAALLVARGAPKLVAVDGNSEAVPIGLFAAAHAGVPYVPVNYRLADDKLQWILKESAPAVAVVESGVPGRLGDGIDELDLIDRATLLAGDPGGKSAEPGDPEEIAVLLFTSGTTGDPKAAVLRHRHLTSYVISTVEFMGADEDEAALVSVPPYHIAAMSAVLSSVFAGRRLVYLPQFTPEAWVTAAREESITHAMVVPTMLGRILDVLDEQGESLPSLRHLSYGGGRMPHAVVERALTLLPGVGFVNAYGLTETSSTVAVLTPDDHRAAMAVDDPAVRARLGSVGRPLPVLELSIRDEEGNEVGTGVTGEVWVRGEQVSGEYLGRSSSVDSEGWFHTNDGGYLDEEGFLFVEGRLDDVIVRGGENLSPGSIEDCLREHPAVEDVAVFGVPDDEWGEAVVCAVVLREDTTASAEELQAWVRERLRSTCTPTAVHFETELPYNETGKLLRRVLKAQLSPVGD
jgi:acyl-CoA synthetase (AMP-forming)/AMP-acid ligase II